MIWVLVVLFIIGALIFAPRLVGGTVIVASALVFYGVIGAAILAAMALLLVIAG